MRKFNGPLDNARSGLQISSWRKIGYDPTFIFFIYDLIKAAEILYAKFCILANTIKIQMCRRI